MRAFIVAVVVLLPGVGCSRDRCPPFNDTSVARVVLTCNEWGNCMCHYFDQWGGVVALGQAEP